MATEKFWNIAAQGREASVDIFGVVGDFGLMEESVAASQFMRDMRAIGKVNRLNITIHSPGGSVYDGIAIYNTLRDFQAEKIVYVPALAASIATVIMLAGDKVIVSPESEGMIHDPYMVAGIGSASEAAAVQGLWNSAKERILNIYERRTGADRDKLSDLMAAETWFTGAELVEMGFADELKEDQPKMRVAAFAPALLAHYRNVPESLIKRKPQPLSPEIAARVIKCFGEKA